MSASATITEIVINGYLAYGGTVTAGNSATGSTFNYGDAIDVHVTGSVGQRVRITPTDLSADKCLNVLTSSPSVYTFSTGTGNHVTQEIGGHIEIYIEDTTC